MAVARNVTKSNEVRRVLPDLSNQIPGNATKATPRSAAVKKEFFSPLATALMETFAPVVKALDDKPALLMEDSADNGLTAPSMNDVALKIAFGTVLSFFHRQNNGTIRVQKKDKNGKPIEGQFNTYDNNKERLDKSEEAVSKLEDIDDKRSFATLYWHGVNEARYFAYNDMIHAWASVYREIFREDWKPMDEQNQTTVEKIDMSKLPETEKNKWAERLAEAKKARAA